MLSLSSSMLSAGKFGELSEKAPGLKEYYALQDNGFYRANVPAGKEKEVRELFSTLGFSALNFTDHRSRFQFYNTWRRSRYPPARSMST